MWRGGGRSGGKKSQRERDAEEDQAGLLVFGYACKLFDNDDKGQWVAEERHLIPWNDDESLKIDRYDCRLHLHDLKQLEPTTAQTETDHDEDLFSADRAEEELCDEERYKDLHAAIDQEERDEEERKRATGNGAQIPFSYGADTSNAGISAPDEQDEDSSSDEDEPFVPPPDLKLPLGIDMPETMKLNAIIEKTALFVVSQGSQMEIVIKAKQRNNLDQFGFLDWDHKLNNYYKYISKMIREKRYTPRPHEPKKKPPKPVRSAALNAIALAHNSGSDDDGSGSDGEGGGGYLHPSLMGGGGSKSQSQSGTNSPAPPVLPHVPSVSYKLGEEDDVYSALYNKLSAFMPSFNKQEDAPTAPVKVETDQGGDFASALHNEGMEMTQMANEERLSAGELVEPPQTDRSEAPPNDFADWYQWFYGRPSVLPVQPTLIPPPPDLAPVVYRTAEFVAKFGPAAEDHLRRRPELHLDFLYPDHPYHASYQMRIRYVQWEQYCAAMAAQMPPAPQQPEDATPGEQSAVVPEKEGDQPMDQSASPAAAPQPTKRKRRFFHDGPLPTTESSEQESAPEQKPLFTGPISFSIGVKQEEQPAPIISSNPIAADGSTNDDETKTGDDVSDPSLQSQMNEEANPADVQRQHDRKEKARAFLERILNEKRAAKKRQEAETARLMAEVTEAAERASRLATECVEQTVENRPQADRRSTSRLKETGELSDSSSSVSSNEDRARKRRRRTDRLPSSYSNSNKRRSSRSRSRSRERRHRRRSRERR